MQPVVYDSNVLCKHPFVATRQETSSHRFVEGLTNCARPCTGLNYFDERQQTIANYWLIVWSSLCLFSSFCTTLTYLIQSSRFRYPEKPIIYLSMSYLFVAIGYLLRFIIGRDQTACGLSQNESRTSFECTLSFALVYYFGMASSVWWVIVSFTWFLAAGLKWGSEAIASYRVYFHACAWLLPFLQTVAVLAFSYVDSDSLAGICFVGNMSTHSLVTFLIAPSILYLGVGITFLVAGFVSLFRIRKLIRQKQCHSTRGTLESEIGQKQCHSASESDYRYIAQKSRHGASKVDRREALKAHKLEKLMVRIGIFSILYTVPATCVIACQLYERVYRDEWERNFVCRNAGNAASRAQFCAESSLGRGGLASEPEFAIFLLKYLMSLIVGVTSGFWIWTNKTWVLWKSFVARAPFCSRFLPSSRSSAAISSASSTTTNTTMSDSLATQSDSACLAFCCPRPEKQRHTKTKDSIVYFQANEDIETNPHNFYDKGAQQHMHLNAYPQMLIDDNVVYQKHYASTPMPHNYQHATGPNARVQYKHMLQQQNNKLYGHHNANANTNGNLLLEPIMSSANYDSETHSVTAQPVYQSNVASRLGGVYYEFNANVPTCNNTPVTTGANGGVYCNNSNTMSSKYSVPASVASSKN